MVVYIGALLFLKIDIYLTRWRNRANFFKKRNLKHTIFAMFTQFQFCQLCRLNHKKKRKHIYSIRHQNVVNNILEKYLRKVSFTEIGYLVMFQRVSNFGNYLLIDKENRNVVFNGLFSQLNSYLCHG